MGMGDERGQVWVEYLAGPLLVDGDPTDNVAPLPDKNRPTLILRGGKLYKTPLQLQVAR